MLLLIFQIFKQNFEAGVSQVDSVWPVTQEDIADSTKLSDATDDLDGLLSMMDKDDDVNLDISIDERQIEQIESELGGEESLLMVS
jgi:hypothetical protein